jgi:hypothetical protein
MSIVPVTYHYYSHQLKDDSKKEEHAVIKGAIPRDIKYRFKIVCIQQELDMSTVLEQLIQDWVQKESPILKHSVNSAQDELEDVKAYVSKSLKLQFKIICAQKKLKMRFVLQFLINQWLQSIEPMFTPFDTYIRENEEE